MSLLLNKLLSSTSLLLNAVPTVANGEAPVGLNEETAS